MIGPFRDMMDLIELPKSDTKPVLAMHYRGAAVEVSAPIARIGPWRLSAFVRSLGPLF